MRAVGLCLILTISLGIAFSAPAAPLSAIPASVQVHVTDIARVQSDRDNQLIGFGLVVGLNGTGDSSQTPFTTQALSNLLNSLDITVQASRLKAKNVAAVIVTADIPAFIKTGDRIDINVSSLGDASSLQGGTLLQTPLKGADGNVYAVAQGSISLGGYSAAAGGSSKSTGHPTVGRIPEGALVEMEIPNRISSMLVQYSLHTPDFTTASRMAAAINQVFPGKASARDAGGVCVQIPAEYQDRPVDFISRVNDVTLTPYAPAKVVMNERTGTVVIGGSVAILPVALAHGNLTVTVTPAFIVSQPLPKSEGETVVIESADVKAKEPQVSLARVPGGTVEQLVQSLNTLKVSPRDIMAILQGLKASGALQAELEII